MSDNEKIAHKIVEGWAPKCSSLTDDITEALDQKQAEIDDLKIQLHERLEINNTQKDEISRLEKELAEASEVIIKHQWASCDGCGNTGYCPECGMPEMTVDESVGGGLVHGTHLVVCSIGLTIQKSVNKGAVKQQQGGGRA